MRQPSYAALESGRSKSTSKIGSLSRVLAVDAYWLETGTGVMRGAVASGVAEQRGLYLTDDELRLLSAFRALPAAKRRTILQLITD